MKCGRFALDGVSMYIDIYACLGHVHRESEHVPLIYRLSSSRCADADEDDVLRRNLAIETVTNCEIYYPSLKLTPSVRCAVDTHAKENSKTNVVRTAALQTPAANIKVFRTVFSSSD